MIKIDGDVSHEQMFNLAVNHAGARTKVMHSYPSAESREFMAVLILNEYLNRVSPDKNNIPKLLDSWEEK